MISDFFVRQRAEIEANLMKVIEIEPHCLAGKDGVRFSENLFLLST